MLMNQFVIFWYLFSLYFCIHYFINKINYLHLLLYYQNLNPNNLKLFLSILIL